MNVLETTRLSLRHLAPSDAAFVLELVNEPAWLQFIGDRGVRTCEDALAYIATGPVAMYASHGFGLFAVERKSDGECLGICGLIKRETLPEVDLGFAFLERFWGRGYAHEAAAGVLAHGIFTLKIPHIIAVTASGNVRSGRLLEKLGFRYDRMVSMAEGKPASRLFVHAAVAATTA